ncbi:hypothetical protein K7432_009071 [Basidiobolus ranarum]|uniref:Phosphatidylglycerol/phosphatidylinositol transfer protein n=1 Tax=Basidiobolus ranarum TaxID=34480 RepID=A0ABR2WQV8_9FUNG
MLYSKNIIISSLFIALTTALFFQSALSETAFGRCGNPGHSWNPINGTATFNINNRAIDIQVTGEANDTLYGFSQAKNRSASAIYVISTLNYRDSVKDSDLCASLGKCPAQGGKVTLNKVLNLPTYVPFVGVQITGLLIDEEGGEYGCFTTSVNQTEETYYNIVVIVMLCTLILPIISLCFGYIFGNVRDIFAYTSSLGIDGRMQSFRYPGVFDMVNHFQFLVITGLLNLDYSFFYQKFVSKFHSAMGILADNITNNGAIKASGVDVVTHITPNLSIKDRGILFFAHLVGLESNELLVSLLIFMSFVLVAVLLISGLINGVAILAMRSDGAYYSQKKLFAFTLGNILRFLLLFHLPLTLFAFNQLMIHDPIWLTVVAAILVILLSLAVIAGALVYLTRISPVSIIFIDTFYMLTFGPLYNTYTTSSYRYAWVKYGHHVILAGIIAFGQRNGLVQLILVLCLELGMFYACVGIHPYISSNVNRWETIFQAFRVVLVALLFVYLPAIKTSDEAKDWCGLISIFLILIFQLFWVIRAIACLLKIIIHRYTKPTVINDISLSTTPNPPSHPRGISLSRISAPTSVVSGPPFERPLSSEQMYGGYRPRSDNVSHTSSVDGMGLSPYDRYMASLRESAGLRQEVLIDDTTDTRSSANLSVSTFSPKPAYSSHHSHPSQSSFVYEDIPHPRDSAGSQRQMGSLPKFFSANNET